MKYREVVKTKYIDIILYVLAFTAVGVFTGISTAIFLVFFMLLFALVTYSTIGVYSAIRGIRDKWLLWKIISTIVVGAIIYLIYGGYALMRAVSFALVITTITLLLVKFYINRK